MILYGDDAKFYNMVNNVFHSTRLRKGGPKNDRYFLTLESANICTLETMTKTTGILNAK